MERFYATSNSSTGLNTVQRAKEASIANRAAENASIDLTVKTMPELLELLTHRDYFLRGRVVTLLKFKAVDSTAVDDVRRREQTLEHLFTAPAIQALFDCMTIEENPTLQADALSLVSGILNETLKDRIRQVGCFPILSTLWKRGTEESLLTKILSLTQELTTNEQNCMACKQTKRVSELCFLLESSPTTTSTPAGAAPSSLPPVSIVNRALLVGILRNVSKVKATVDQIAKSNVHNALLELVNCLWRKPQLKGEQVPGKDAMLTQQILEILANLALGRIVKARMTPVQYQLLTNMMEPEKTLRKDWMKSRQPEQEFFIASCIQGQLLQFLSRVSVVLDYEDEQDYDVSARRLLAQQLGVIERSLSYLGPSASPATSIAADPMLYVLDLIFNLVKRDESNIERFLDANGLQLVTHNILSAPKLPEYLQHIALNRRAIEIIHLTSIGKLFGSENVSSSSSASISQFVQPVMGYALQYPEDTPLIISVYRFMKDLAAVPHHCQSLPYQCFQYAIHCVKTHAVADVIIICTQFLHKAASHSDNNNARSILVQSSVDFVPTLLSYLGNDNQTLQVSIVTLLASVYATDAARTTSNGGKQIVDNSGILILVSLINSQASCNELKHQSLVILDLLLKNYVNNPEELRLAYLAADALPPIISCLTSSYEPMQLSALTIVARLASHRACKMAMDNMGVETQLKELQKLTAKNPNDKVKMALHDRVSTILPLFAGTIATYNNAAEMVEKNAVDATDELLSQLTKWQLKQLVKHAMNSLPEMMEMVSDTVHANLANPPEKKKKKSPSSSSDANASNSLGVDSTPVVASMGLNNNSGSSYSSPPPPPPPSSGSAPPPPRAPAPSSSNQSAIHIKKPNMGNFFDSLSAAVGADASRDPSSKSPRLQLRKVTEQNTSNADADKEARRKEKEKAKAKDPRTNSSMSSVFQGLKDAASNPEGTRLIEQGTSNGKQFWVRDMGKYIEEIQKSFQLDFNFMKILLHIISSTTSTITFESIINMAHDKKNKPIDPETLSKQLINLGFSTKHNIILLPGSDTPVTQYTNIIVPGDMPMQAIARTIVWTVSQSHGPVASTPSSLGSSSSKLNAPSPVLHSSSQKNSPTATPTLSLTPSASPPPSSAAGDSHFDCRLCKANFPISEAVDIQTRLFCGPCSATVKDALSKRGQ